MPSVYGPWPPAFRPIEMVASDDTTPMYDVQHSTTTEATMRSPLPAYRRWSRLGSLASLFKPRTLSRGEDTERGTQVGTESDTTRANTRRQQRRQERGNALTTRRGAWRTLGVEVSNNRQLILFLALGVFTLVCLVVAAIGYHELRQKAMDNVSDSFICGHNPVAPKCKLRISNSAIVGDQGALVWLEKHCSWQGMEWLCTSTKGDGVTKSPQP